MKNFIEFARQLFDNELLASVGTVSSVLEKYELAKQHGHEYVGVVQKDYKDLYEETTHVYKGANGEKIGVLQVRGALTYEESLFTALCGMTSYEGLQNKADYLIKERGIDHLVLEINSGGGMAYGCFEKADYVKRLAQDNGVKITSYVDGVGFSGGYAWCSIADEVVMNPMASVGSIGVVLPLVNTSEMDKKEGIQRIYITAGKSKVPFDKDGNFTDKFLDKIKAGVAETYDMFVDHVATMRGMDKEAVINTEADTFRAKEAIKLGLADKIMTVEDFHNYIGKLNGETKMSIENTKATAEKVEAEKTNSLVMSQLSAQIQSLEGDKSTLVAQVADLTGERDTAVSELATAKTQIANLTAQLEGAQAQAKVSETKARREAISALVPVDAIEDHMSFVADFDAEKFDKYKANLETQKQKISASFEEQGIDAGDGEAEQLSVEDATVARLRARKQAKA